MRRKRRRIQIPRDIRRTAYGLYGVQGKVFHSNPGFLGRVRVSFAFPAAQCFSQPQRRVTVSIFDIVVVRIPVFSTLLLVPSLLRPSPKQLVNRPRPDKDVNTSLVESATCRLKNPHPRERRAVETTKQELLSGAGGAESSHWPLAHE